MENREQKFFINLHIKGSVKVITSICLTVVSVYVLCKKIRI